MTLTRRESLKSILLGALACVMPWRVARAKATETETFQELFNRTRYAIAADLAPNNTPDRSFIRVTARNPAMADEAALLEAGLNAMYVNDPEMRERIEKQIAEQTYRELTFHGVPVQYQQRIG